MNAKTTPVLIVLVSVFLSVSLSLLLEGGGSAENRAASAAPRDHRAGQALELRISELERRVDELRPSLSTPEALSETVPQPAQRTDLTAGAEHEHGLDARLAVLERLLARIEASPRGIESTPREVQLERALRAEDRERQRVAETLDAQAILADAGATVAERLAAHEALRRVADAYTPSMVQGLVHIGASDPDPEARANVWRCFDGSSHLPELVPHLLQALSMDPDAHVRDEASETLGNYLDDPAVLAALKFAAENDESPRVRQKALRTLSESSWLATDR